jgi:hypothetical protein
MKRIEINQMEFIDGGRSAKDNASCALALVGLVAAGVGLATLTVGTGGAALWAAAIGWSVTPTGAALSCL